jgi:hypothetical protein
MTADRAGVLEPDPLGDGFERCLAEEDRAASFRRAFDERLGRDSGLSTTAFASGCSHHVHNPSHNRHHEVQHDHSDQSNLHVHDHDHDHDHDLSWALTPTTKSG